ncbi:DUF4192 domain-containing protein [Amycolatopsis oliviviridis]|uniref:DUF4192 domain-containing protein n=1 Tax=Amycolatopsis oliviviridis TaxID=1471590 RepID=A0ABQ3LDJ2_9PSEU|nr:DUF4192 domain-containing protein [Amycolatopsis oliviviridis]GHH12228.1 hypothetical protein GCM10017790_23390 [Amycolatopsis oliviviridis]
MTTTTPTGRTKVDLKDPADLLAAIPYILGFHPENSVVVFGQKGPDRTSQGLTMRVDLPPPALEKDQALDLAARLSVTGHTGATVAVVGGGSPNPAGRPPRRRFLRRLESSLAEDGIPLLHSLWAPSITEGARWRCYRDRDCGGLLPDPRKSVAAAVTTSEGHITYESREDLERLFEAGPPETLARRADMLTRMGGPPWGDDDLVEAGLAEVNAALARTERGDEVTTDEQAVRLAWALSLVEVRDACLLTAAPAGAPLARAAEALWLRLARELPEPESAEALCLKAHAAYARGDLTIANMALVRAREVDPEHRMARLLAAALDGMLAPSEVARIVLRQRAEEPPALRLRPSGGTE